MNKDKLNWRLPNKDELVLMYENLHEESLGNFALDYYWSSSEHSSDGAWLQRFSNGYQSAYIKDGSLRVRAVQSFHSKAGGDTYKIGEDTPKGFVFDIQDDMIFICKKEDEPKLMTWGEAMEKLGGKK